MDALYYLSISAYVLFFLVYRLLTVLAVYKSAKSHNLQATKLWVIFTALFGIVSAAVYLIFEDKSNEALPKERRKAITLEIAAFIMIPLCIIYTFAVYSPVQDKITEYDNNHFGSTEITFKNENGEDVIYDRTGKAYTFEQYKNNEFTYYAKDGTTYHPYSKADPDGYSDEYGIKCEQTGVEYQFGPFSDYDYYIGEDGYVYIFSDDDLNKKFSVYLDPDEERGMLASIYFTKNGMLLYDTYDCAWDKDGNLVFQDSYKYKNFKYSDIPKDQLDWD